MLAAIGEIPGSAAVLLTLIYLALQTRQNTTSVQASTRHAFLESDLQFVIKLADDPALVSLCYKLELTGDERIGLGTYWIALLRMREILWLQYENGILDEATWESFRNPQSSSCRI